MTNTRLRYYVVSEFVAAGRWSTAVTDDRAVDEVLISAEWDDSDDRVEAAFTFMRISTRVPPKFCIFQDRWAGLKRLGPAFIEALARLDGKHLGRTPSVADVCGVLERQGFVRADPTDRSEP